MAGQVQVDTAAMQSTAQQSGAIADQMIEHARTLRAGVEYVQSWQGEAAKAFMTTMSGQSALLDQLITKLKEVAELVNRGGQGFDSQDAAGRSNLTAQGQNFLNGQLNH
jgi:WXG100 family type VII secretion target